MSAAWREVTAWSRREARLAVLADRDARKALADHLATRAGRLAHRGWQSQVVPVHSSVERAGDVRVHARWADGWQLIDDPDNRDRLSPRQLQTWELDRRADELLELAEVAAWLSGKRFHVARRDVDIAGREVVWTDDTRFTVTTRRHMDVWSREHRSMLTRPDRVAFRGVARPRRPRPAKVTPAANVTRGSLIWSWDGKVWDPRGAWSGHHDDSAAHDAVTLGLAVESMPVRVIEYAIDQTRGHAVRTIIGVRRGVNVTRVTARGKRAIAREIRAAADIRPMGRPVGAIDAWTVHRGNLARECARRNVSHVAAAIASRIAQAATDGVIALSVDHYVTRDGKYVTADGRAPMTSTEYARRAALAGLTID